MKILPINSIQSKQQNSFGAKFRSNDIKEFLIESQFSDVDILPRLYTMLDIIKKQPGNEAKIQHIGLWHRILIDGKSLNGKNKYFCALHALQEAVVMSKNTLIKHKTPIKRLSDDEFKKAYCENSNKTINDIKSLF